MRFKDSFHPYAILTIICWALAYVFSRLAMGYFTPYALGFLRYVVATTALLTVVIALKIKPPAKKDFIWFILSGLIGFFGYMVTFNRGTALVSSGTSAVIIATAPVITAFLARIIYKEKLALYQWVAVAIEFSGILVITLWGGTFTINEGIVWLVLASFALGLYNLIQRKLIRTYEPLTITAYSIFIGTIFLTMFSPSAITQIKSAPAGQYVNLFVLGVLSSAVAYVAWAKAFSKAENTAVVSNYMFLTPFLSALFGFVFASEVPDAATFVGGAVIMCGVLLFSKNSLIKKKN